MCFQFFVGFFQVGQYWFQVEVYVEVFQVCLYGFCCGWVEQVWYDLFVRCYYVELVVVVGEVVGEFVIDQFCIEQQYLVFVGSCLVEVCVVFQVVDWVECVLGIVFDWYLDWFCVLGQDQVVIMYFFFVDLDLLMVGIDIGDLGMGQDVCVQLFGYGVWFGYGQVVGVFVF